MKQVLIFTFILLTSCAQNIYTTFGNTLTDPALLEAARINMNNSDWDTALEKFSLMSPSYRSQRSVALQYASTLASKCGFNYLNFAQALGTASIGSGVGEQPLFYWLMNQFMGVETNLLVTGVTNPSSTSDSYCSSAQQVMDDVLDNYGGWNNEERLFVVMFSLAKIGIYLRSLADADGVDNLGSGQMDATFDACETGTDFKDFYATQIVTGFALVIQNYSGLITGGAETQLDALAVLCDDPPTGLGLTVCSHTAVADVTADDRKNARALIMMSKISPVIPGIGAHNDDVDAGVNNDPAVGTRWVCSGNDASAPPNPVFNCCP